MPKLRMGDETGNSVTDLMNANGLVPFELFATCSASFFDSSSVCTICMTYKFLLLASVSTRYEDVGSISALKNIGLPSDASNRTVCKHSQDEQHQTLYSVLLSAAVIAYFQRDVLKSRNNENYSVWKTTFTNRLRSLRLTQLLILCDRPKRISQWPAFCHVVSIDAKGGAHLHLCGNRLDRNEYHHLRMWLPMWFHRVKVKHLLLVKLHRISVHPRLFRWHDGFQSNQTMGKIISN